MGKSTTTTTMAPEQREFMGVVTGAAKDIYGTEYQPYTGDRVAGMTGLQSQALQGYGGLTLPSELSAASEYVLDFMGRTPNQTAAALADYTGQYTQNVIDPTIALMNRQRQKAITGEEANIARAGAFGSRGDVYMGERQGEYEAQLANTIGNLQAQGYQGAVARMQAEDAARLGAAGQLAGLGMTSLGAQKDIAGAQMSAGEAERLLGQQELDAMYNAYLMEQQYPLQQFGVLTGAAGAFPAGLGTTTQTPSILDNLGRVAAAGSSAGMGFPIA